MSNSSLVTYIKKSPNHSGKRAYTLSRITIHHMAGVLTVEQCGEIFARPSRQASSNYGIDSKGHVGLYVDEKNRSWASSSRDNDNRAITIEVSNNKVGGKWTVSKKALNKTIELCIDICKRNGKTRVIWFGSKAESLSYKPKKNEIVLTVHRWFAPTSCCGDYLYGKMPYIAKKINEAIKSATDEKKTVKTAKYVPLTTMNVRKEADDSSAIVGSAPKGREFTATQEKQNGRQTWVYASEYRGWICKKGKKTYLKEA